MKKTVIGILLVMLVCCAAAVMPVSAAEVPLNTVETFYNIVILAEFAGDSYSSEDLRQIDRIFNDDQENEIESVKEYFWRLSGNRLTVESVFVLYSDVSMTKTKFKNLDNYAEITYITGALRSVSKQGGFSDTAENVSTDRNVPFTASDFDANDDGVLDSVVFYPNLYFENTSSDNQSAIWPHAMIGLGNASVSASGGVLGVERYIMNPYQYYEEYAYGFTTQTKITSPIGVICHEMLHNLGESQGIDDLYHYEDGGDALFETESPVGIWDVMAATDYQHPQVLNAYYLSLLGWAELKDADSGENLLEKKELGSAVRFGEKNGEFFVAEYRPSVTTNGVTTEEGIVVYRVNTNVKTGNRVQGKDKSVNNDQIYFFRKNECYNGMHRHEGIFSSDISTCDYFKCFTTGDKVELTYADGSACELSLKVGENGEDGYIVSVEERTVDLILRFVDENGALLKEEIFVSAGGESLGSVTKGSCIVTAKYGQTLFFTSENYRFPSLTAEESGNISVTGKRLYDLTFVVLDAEGNAVVGAEATDGTSSAITDESGRVTLRSTLDSVVVFRKEGFKEDEFLFSALSETETEIRLKKAVNVTLRLHFPDQPVGVQILYEGKTYHFSVDGTLTLENVGVGDCLILQGNHLLFYSDETQSQAITELVAEEGVFDVYVVCPETEFTITLLDQNKQKISSAGAMVLVNGEPTESVTENDTILFTAKVGDTVTILLQGYRDYEFRLTSDMESILTVYLKPSYTVWYWVAGGLLLAVLIVAAAVMVWRKKRR